MPRIDLPRRPYIAPLMAHPSPVTPAEITPRVRKPRKPAKPEE